MPELPEVETIRRQLAPLVEGRRLERIEILDERWSRPRAPRELEDALEGRRVEDLGRRGKYLVWSFEDDVHLAQHLRMTGAVLSVPDADHPGIDPPHTRVRLVLGEVELPGRVEGHGPGTRPGPLVRDRDPRGKRRLAIVDPRRFGTGEVLLGARELEGFFSARLGLEPFDGRFTAEHLHGLARGRKGPIKALLLDQRRIAGVGNIYADEALFRSGIHPLRPAGRVSRAQHAVLRESLIEVLRAGIDAQGATIDDFRHLDGVRGSFQDQFLVHMRADEPCARCGAPIVKIVAAGRGTYVCEACQPVPRGPRKGRSAPPVIGFAGRGRGRRS